MIYDDYGTHGSFNISVWQANTNYIPGGAYLVGQVAVPDHVTAIPTSAAILVKPLVQSDSYGPLIVSPIDYEPVWNDKGSGGRINGSFWKVVAPYGYVALGDVACSDYDKPSSIFTGYYACIREDLVREGTVDPKPIWTDVGSGATGNVSIWNVNGNGVGGFYKAQKGYDRPTDKVFVLCGGPYWSRLWTAVITKHKWQCDWKLLTWFLQMIVITCRIFAF